MADYTDAEISDDGFDEAMFDDVVSAELVMPTPSELAAPLSPEEARDLTATIRNAAEMLWMLIMRAHQGRAWEALAYPSWEAYVRAEFDMSRSRSYQLLDQGRVIQAIEAALPDNTDVSISEAAARDLKGVLDEVIPEIRERTEGLEPTEAATVLDEIVEEQRDRLREERAAAAETDEADDDDFVEYDGPYTGTGGGGPYPDFADADDEEEDGDDSIYDDVDNIDVARIRRNVNAAHDVYSALSALASLPDALEEVIAIIPDERHAQIDANLSKAIDNLARFRELWQQPAHDDEEPEEA